MADIYKSVHENQLRNRLQILHVIDVDSANINKAFATDIEKAKDSAKEEKIRKVMKEFKEGTLKSSSGELVTDRKQAIAIAISEAENIEKSDDADSDSSEEPIEKAQKANIGDIHIWGGKRYKKIANGKWVEISFSHGMTKREHENKYKKEKQGTGSIAHLNTADSMSDKEYTDEEVGRGGKKEETIMELVGGDDSWTPKKKAMYLANHLGHKDLVEHISGLKESDSSILPRLRGLEDEYMNKDSVKKSVFDEIQENIEKSLNSISTKVSEEILNDIEKSVNHKYFKREGTPGNYKYYYTEEEYKKKKGDSKIEDETEVKMDYLKYRLANHYNISSQSRLSNLKLDGTDSALDLSRALNLPIDDTNFTGVNNTIKKMRDEYVKEEDYKGNKPGNIEHYEKWVDDKELDTYFSDENWNKYSKQYELDSKKPSWWKDNSEDFVNDKQETTISKLKEKYNEDYSVNHLGSGSFEVKFNSGKIFIINRDGVVLENE